jgi:hypothetical protein
MYLRVAGLRALARLVAAGRPPLGVVISGMSLAEDFEKHGAAVIEKVRTDRPADYLKIVSALLPKDVNLNVRPFDELTDDQLLARLAQLTELAKPLLAKLETDRDEAEPEASRH